MNFSADSAAVDQFAGENAPPTPLYSQIKRRIQAKVNLGEWKPNSKIPSESDLCDKFSVSRMTVNRALRELVEQGVLMRLPGVGTFVAESKMESTLMSVRNIADEIAAHQNHRHSAEVRLLEQSWANAELASTMNIKLRQIVFHSVILHFDNDTPVQLEDRYVNSQVAPDYLGQDFTLQTPNAYLTAVAPLTEGEHIVEAVLASPKEAELLRIDHSVPCLQLRRKTWSYQNVVTFARLLYPGTRYRLEGKFRS
ncbi:MAG: histidine utilization repressor [Deltaproteobacteria bacterium]|jgi:GntR family histidine utilization transcriptional repressor|nr:histidine utilization repressor [Deltaproteobacteria bacterium]